jgi:hypothetical protein
VAAAANFGMLPATKAPAPRMIALRLVSSMNVSPLRPPKGSILL